MSHKLRKASTPWLGGASSHARQKPRAQLLTSSLGRKTVKPFTVMFSKKHFEGANYCINRHGIEPMPVVFNTGVVEKLPSTVKTEIGKAEIQQADENEVMDWLWLRNFPSAYRLKKTVSKNKKKQSQTWEPSNPISEGALSKARAIRYQHFLTKVKTWRASHTYKQLWDNFLAKLPINRETNVPSLSSRVSFIAGETGSGKSTQIPQIILDEVLNNNTFTKVIVTQPRRIAATSLAARVAKERGEDIGETIGYHVSLDKVLPSSPCHVLFCTTGVAVRRISSGQDLSDTHIIIDEVHETTIENDHLLYLVREALHTTPSLKVTLMSATISFDPYLRYFAAFSPATDVFPSRLHPVTEHYLCDPSLAALDLTFTKAAYELPAPPMDDVVTVLKWLIDQPGNSGSVLVFLPGISEISGVAKMLEKECPGLYPVRLYSSAPKQVFEKAFSLPPTGLRKVILTTNVAESSITIPDVTAVLNTCLVNESSQDHNRGSRILLTTRCSKANNKQRAGRAGRVAPGIVVQMLTRSQAQALPEFSTPELQRSRLDGVVLSLFQADPLLEDVGGTLAKFMNAPTTTSVEAAIESLMNLGALVVKEGKLTISKLGKQLALLPVTPAQAKLLLLGCAMGCINPVLTLVSLPDNGMSKEKMAIKGHSEQVAKAFSFRDLEYHSRGRMPTNLKGTVEKRAKIAQVLSHAGFIKPVKVLDTGVLDFSNVPQNRHGGNEAAVRAVLAMAYSDNLCRFGENRQLMVQNNCSVRSDVHGVVQGRRNVSGIYETMQLQGDSQRLYGITVLSPLMLMVMSPRVTAVQYVNDADLTGVIVGDWLAFVLPTLHAKYALVLHTMVQKALRQHFIRKSTFSYHATQHIIDAYLALLWEECHPNEQFPAAPVAPYPLKLKPKPQQPAHNDEPSFDEDDDIDQCGVSSIFEPDDDMY